MHPLIAEALEAGRVAPVQLPSSKAGKAEGYAYFEFLGGTYDGVTIRLYAPFSDALKLIPGETYFHSPPKNGRSKRLTYRTKDYEPRSKPRRAKARVGDPASAA